MALKTVMAEGVSEPKKKLNLVEDRLDTTHAEARVNEGPVPEQVESRSPWLEMLEHFSKKADERSKQAMGKAWKLVSTGLVIGWSVVVIIVVGIYGKWHGPSGPMLPSYRGLTSKVHSLASASHSKSKVVPASVVLTSLSPTSARAEVYQATEVFACDDSVNVLTDTLDLYSARRGRVKLNRHTTDLAKKIVARCQMWRRTAISPEEKYFSSMAIIDAIAKK